MPITVLNYTHECRDKAFAYKKGWAMMDRQDAYHTPTLQELRKMLDLSPYALARAAGVRPRVAYWMEVGVTVSKDDAMKKLGVISRLTGNNYTIFNVRGLKIRESPLLP